MVLSIGRTTMYELVGAGEIDVVHIGRSVRVPVTRSRRSSTGSGCRSDRLPFCSGQRLAASRPALSSMVAGQPRRAAGR